MKLCTGSTLLICMAIIIGTVMVSGVVAAAESKRPVILTPTQVPLFEGKFYTDGSARCSKYLQVEVNVVTDSGGFSSDGKPVDALAWGPALELGYQASDSFDLFSSFSRQTVSGSGSMSGETIADNLAYKLDLSDYQFRIGARSWAPVYGAGRFGINIGSLFSVMPFRLDVNRQSGGISQGGSHADTWSAYGGFLGMDAEVRYGPAFAKGRIEGTLVSRNQYGQLLGLETNVNTSGLSLSVGGGIRF